jgi:hypothetical protein
MARVLSILVAVAVVVVLVTLIGMVIRTPRFAEIREEVESKVRSATEDVEVAAEQPLAEA